jgi:hypothetical protein
VSQIAQQKTYVPINNKIFFVSVLLTLTIYQIGNALLRASVRTSDATLPGLARYRPNNTCYLSLSKISLPLFTGSSPSLHSFLSKQVRPAVVPALDHCRPWSAHRRLCPHTGIVPRVFPTRSHLLHPGPLLVSAALSQAVGAGTAG